MKYLILIDHFYPYLKGETFLENELSVLAKHFDQIMIFPIEPSKSADRTRIINESNVISEPINTFTGKIRKYFDFLNGSRHYFKENSNYSFMQKIELILFKASSDSMTKKLIKRLDKINFSSNDEIYIYSYWLHKSAYISKELNNYFKGRELRSFSFSRAHRFDIYEEDTKSQILPYQYEIIGELDGVFSISQDGANYLKEKYPDLSSKVYLSRLGTIDYGLSSMKKTECFHIVSVSWMIKRKRIDYIIKAVKQASAANKNIFWTHIGSGEEEDALKQLANKELDSSSYQFLGSKNNKEVYDFYKENSIDAFINVSTSEGVPVSIMEAISFGIPVVATNVGGTSEIVEDGQNGFLLSKDLTVEDLSKKISYLGNLDDENSTFFRENARKIWEDRYQAFVNYEDFIAEVFESFKNKYNERV